MKFCINVPLCHICRTEAYKCKHDFITTCILSSSWVHAIYLFIKCLSSAHSSVLGQCFPLPESNMVLTAAAAAAWSLQSCPTLCEPRDYSPPGSSVYGILQARILEWVAMPSYRGSSQPRDQTQVSRIAGSFFTAEPPRRPS